MTDKIKVAAAFTRQAEAYDSVAAIQREVARRLAQRIVTHLPTPPARILEIGCGTGLLSAELAAAFPKAELLLTDISPAMLERARARLGDHAQYRVLDGEHPAGLEGGFDLIASSLAMQWFTDLPGALARLSRLLAPGGRLCFATLGAGSFVEWRAAHEALALPCGLHDYPDAATFPWPPGAGGALEEDSLTEHHASGQAFAKTLKTLGANEPSPGHRPLPPSAFRKLLDTLQGTFPVTYHVLYGEILNAGAQP
jgi:malonyl-CoA O-methyltransferase